MYLTTKKILFGIVIKHTVIVRKDAIAILSEPIHVCDEIIMV